MSKIPIYQVVNQRSMKKSKDGSKRGSYMQTTCCREKADNVYEFNFDKRDILVVSGLQRDIDSAKNVNELMAKLWAKGRPPGGLIDRRPVVTARQLELIRAQIYGKMSHRQAT